MPSPPRRPPSRAAAAAARTALAAFLGCGAAGAGPAREGAGAVRPWPAGVERDAPWVRDALAAAVRPAAAGTTWRCRSAVLRASLDAFDPRTAADRDDLRSGLLEACRGRAGDHRQR